MNRRSFLALLGAALASPVLTHLPVATPASQQGLFFHPDAFALVMKPLDVDVIRLRYVKPAIEAMFARDEARQAAQLAALGIFPQQVSR